MAFTLDTTMWRVYSAEQSITDGMVFEDIGDAQAFLWRVTSTSWWQSTFPQAPRISLDIDGMRSRTTLVSFAQRLGPEVHPEWRISLHPQMMSSLVLLHEIAHCVAPQTFGDAAAIKRDLVQYGRHHGHGPMFTAAFSALVDRYGLGADSHSLAVAYAHFEVPVATIDELQEAREHSFEIEQLVEEMWARHEESKHEPESQPSSITAATTRVPTESWGTWIWLARRRPFRSQRHLADQISPVIRTSIRDISRLERCDTRPESRDDQRRAVALAAVLGVDPVWAESAYGASPMSTSATLDELQVIAPEWVENVRHLNALLDTRPSVWVSKRHR